MSCVFYGLISIEYQIPCKKVGMKEMQSWHSLTWILKISANFEYIAAEIRLYCRISLQLSCYVMCAKISFSALCFWRRGVYFSKVWLINEFKCHVSCIMWREIWTRPFSTIQLFRIPAPLETSRFALHSFCLFH